MIDIEKLVEECAGFVYGPRDARFSWQTDDYCATRTRAVIRRTLEWAAGECHPRWPRACTCTYCDCGNSGDAQSVADWDARRDCAHDLRSLASTLENSRG